MKSIALPDSPNAKAAGIAGGFWDEQAC